MQQFDLIIVGGGLVGAGLAVALRGSGMRIALIDAREPSNDDPRLFGLNIGSCNFLQHIGIWPSILEYAAPINEVHLSSRGRFGSVRLRREDVHLKSLGHVVPAKWIERSLNAALSTHPDCALYQPANVVSLVVEPGKVVLSVRAKDNDYTLSAPIVIGADGVESTVRQQLQIKTDVHDYQQSAIVTRLKLAGSHNNIAHERFVPNGAIALLPLPENESACIWSTETEHAKELMTVTSQDYLSALQNQFGSRAGEFVGIDKRYIFPLRMVRAQTAVKDGVFLLGNAAHAFHPIAAQGFNLALYEVAVLVEAIMANVGRHNAFSMVDLQQVYDKTQRQQAFSLKVSHELSEGLLGQSFFGGVAMQLGMTTLNLLTPIKKLFLNRMLGRVGSMPKLLLGEMT